MSETIWPLISYTGEYSPKGTRFHERKAFSDSVPIVIETISPEEAPIVARINDLPGAKREIEYRFDGKSFWRPMLDVDETSYISMKDFAARAQTRINPLDYTVDRPRAPKNTIWLDWPFPRFELGGLNGVTYTDPSGLPGRSDIPYRWRGDDLEEQREKAEKAALDIASIGGIIHLKTAEPFLRLSSRTGLHPWPKLPRRIDGVKEHVNEIVVTARLDRIDVMLASAQNWKEISGNPSFSIPDTSSIDIIDSSAFHRNDVKEAANLLFKEITLDIRDALDQIGATEAIRIWCDLQDLANHANEDMNASVEKGLELLHRLCMIGFQPDRDEFKLPDETGLQLACEALEQIVHPLISDYSELRSFEL